MFKNPFKFPVIDNTMHQLKGFQYVISIDLNMVPCRIIIFPKIQYMTTIVTEFGKFRYNCLLIGMFASGDIFKEKLDGILGDIKGVKTYIQ